MDYFNKLKRSSMKAYIKIDKWYRLQEIVISFGKSSINNNLEALLNEDEYISLWLYDKVIEAVDNDPLAAKGIKKH